MYYGYQPICNHWPNIKPSLSMYVHVRNFIVAHAMPRLRGLRMCYMCAMYMTELVVERYMVVYIEWKA